MNPDHQPSAINPQLVYAYTRAQAVADGVLVDVTATAKEAGIRFPTFITRAVWENYVTVPPGVTGQDEAGRLWDVVWMTRFAITRSAPGTSRHRHLPKARSHATPQEERSCTGPQAPTATE
jgi:hypothetical protein